MQKIINYSEVSRMLTGDRTQVRRNYSGNKYKALIDKAKAFEESFIKEVEVFNSETEIMRFNKKKK